MRMPLMRKRKSDVSDMKAFEECWKMRQFNLPGSSENGEAHSKANSDVNPSVRADTVKYIFPTGVLSVEAYLRELNDRICHY